jgi:hypothetical protein
MTNRYLNTVLTVIAVCLVIIALHDTIFPAHAQGVVCGDSLDDACYIRTNAPAGNGTPINVQWTQPMPVTSSN